MASQPQAIHLLPDTSVDDDPAEGFVRCRTIVAAFDEPLEIVADVPDRPMRLSEVVPLAHGICDRMVAASIARAVSLGQTIYCRRGCDACCRKFMRGLAPAEVFFLLEGLASMPPELRRRVGDALQTAARSLDERGMPAAMAKAGDDRAARLVLSDWWDDNMFDCPFLVNESCSIYPARFAVCREFISLSPPAACDAGRSTQMAKPFSMIDVLSELGAGLGVASETVIVMATILLWAQGKTSAAGQTFPGPQLVDRLFDVLARRASMAPVG